MRWSPWLMLISVCLVIRPLEAASLRLTWTAPTLNEDDSPLTDLAGYRIYYGQASGTYTTIVEVGLVTEAILGDLQPRTEYFLAATARDHSGHDSVFSTEISQVTGADPPADTTPPTVALVNPTDGSQVARKSSVTVEAQAQDDTGVIGVELWVNGALLCTRTDAPYRCTWKVPAPPNRTYMLHAQASDAAGHQGRSSPPVTVRSK